MNVQKSVLMEEIMKKYTCLALVLLVSFLLISCGKGVSIDSGNLTQTTVALMKDGSSEMGIVEDFSKDYYQMEDLEDFIHEAVNAFQEDYGKDSVELNYIEKKEQQVHVTLKFKDIEKYAAFNQEEVKLLTFSEAKAQGILPRNMEAADKSGSIGTDSIQDDSCLLYTSEVSAATRSSSVLEQAVQATEQDLQNSTIVVGTGDSAVTMTYGAYQRYLELGSMGVG